MHHRRGVALVSGWVLALSACESSGPSAPARRSDITDPAALSAAALALDSALSSPTVRSLEGLASIMSLTPTYQFPALPVRAQSCAAPASTSGVTARAFARAAIPDSFKGKVFAFDTSSYEFVVTPDSGAPPDGSRFLLPLVDSFGTVIKPVAPAGTFDLLDSSQGTALRFGERLRADSAGVTSLVPVGSQQRYTVVLAGRIAAGAARFTDTVTVQPGAAAAVGGIADSTRVTAWHLAQFRLRFDAFDYRDSFDLNVTTPADTLRAVGIVTVFCGRGATNATIYVSGAPYASTATDAGGTTVTPADSLHPPGAAQVQSIKDLLAARARIYPWLAALVTPTAQFLSP